MDRAGRSTVDPADRVDEVGEARRSRGSRRGRCRSRGSPRPSDLQLRAAERVGGVDLLRALAGDVGEVSRGIESFWKEPPPARTSISVSAREGRQLVGATLAVGGGVDALLLGRAAVRVGDARRSARRCRSRGSSAPLGDAAAGCRRAVGGSSVSLPFWIWAEIAKRTKLSRSQRPRHRDPARPIRHLAAPRLRDRRRRGRAVAQAAELRRSGPLEAAPPCRRCSRRPRRASALAPFVGARACGRGRSTRPASPPVARPRPLIRLGRRCIRGGPGVRGRRVP